MSVALLLGGINELDTIDTDGIACGIFFQGCSRHCPGCHNPELQPFDMTKLTTADTVTEIIKKNRKWYDAVAIMGGEPMEQEKALRYLLREVRELGLETWLYTGYEVEELPSDIVALCSVIVCGEYLEALRTGGFPGSSNQRVIDRRG